MFTSSCGDISAPINTPVSIISFNFISLSITINAPVLLFDNYIAAIVIL